MSNEIQHSKSSAYLAVRFGVLGGVVLVVILVAYGIVQYPSAFALSPVQSSIFLALGAGLLCGYGWLALRRTQSTTRTTDVALRWGGWLGLAAGLCWLIELWAGNLADPSANVIALLAYRGSTVAVPVITALMAFYASRHTRMTQTGLWVGVWGGIISALVTFSGLAIIAYSGILAHDPQTIHQALSSGTTDMMAYSVADALAGAINHLWIGPLLGMTFGALGGLIAAVGIPKNPAAA